MRERKLTPKKSSGKPLEIDWKWLIYIILALGSLGLIYWLYREFPLIAGSKDWLDILSALGQAAGIAVLAALMREVFIHRNDALKKGMPEIYATLKFVKLESIPDDANTFACLVEKDQPKKSQDSLDDYHFTYSLLRHDTYSHFLRIELINRQATADGDARNVRLQIELVLYAGDVVKAEAIPTRFWCPRDVNIVVPAGSGQPKVILIPCGLPVDTKYTHVTGKILDIECVNRHGDPFTKSTMGFISNEASIKSYDKFPNN